MDALTGAEIARAVKLLRDAGHAGEDTIYPEIRLREPPKKEVLAWEPGKPLNRMAFIVTSQGARTFESIVDITNSRMISHKEVEGVQPSITQDEWDRARRLVKADERWQVAMRKRGFDTFDKISCSPLSAGHFPGDITETRRILKVPCYDEANPISGYFARPIEGVLAIVDTNANEVVEVRDGDVVPVPPDPEGAKPIPAREPLKPILNINPQGANFSIKPGWKVNWQNWSFHLRMERRTGPVISLVRFQEGEKNHLLAYQMALSEVFVPYMDPDENWAFRGYMDAGEYGIGYMASPLRPGQDCPIQSTYITLAIPSDKGGQFAVPRGMCIFERNTGDPLWRHGEPGSEDVKSRPAVELVVRMVTTVGNYDYVLDWVFSLNGNIKARVGSTGFLSIKSVKNDHSPNEPRKGDTRFGAIVAPGALAVFHDHFFNFRLDLDVMGQKNALMRDVISPKALNDNRRRSIWVLEPETVKTEGPVRDQPRHEIWRVTNPNKRIPLGHYPGVQLMPGHSVRSLLSVDDPPQTRAAFSTHRLWVTKQKPYELFAAGDYPNQSKGGQGLPHYVEDKEDISNADIVLWYTIGFHHVTRVEDWPIMPVLWHEFMLRPFNLLSRNPSIDLAPDFKLGR